MVMVPILTCGYPCIYGNPWYHLQVMVLVPEYPLSMGDGLRKFDGYQYPWVSPVSFLKHSICLFTQGYPQVIPVGNRYPALKTHRIWVWTFEKVTSTRYPFFPPLVCLRPG